MIISTGMTTISEIAEVVQLVRERNCPFALLHCNASYPTPLEDVNLRTIPYLHEMFDVPIGYSDHTIGNEACLAAVSLGAVPRNGVGIRLCATLNPAVAMAAVPL